jgi:MFS superfamily sulfate permease-like transporter
VIVLGAGLVQVAAGLLRLGQWFRAVSPAVIEGMLAGIGVLIVAGQLHVMVDDEPRGGGLANLLALPGAVAKVARDAGSASHDEAALAGVLTIAALVLWKVLAPKRWQVVPAPLVGIVLATAAAAALRAGGTWPALRPVVMPDRLWDEVRFPSWDALRRCAEGPVLLAIFSVAFIASAETLLCAAAVDQLHRGPRTRYDRELAAQGVGNALCGLLGALPMTGVIVRSAANVGAGARTRLSAVLHGVWLLLLVLLVPSVLALVPRAALAAVLVYTGFKLMNLRAVRHLRSYGPAVVLIYAATLVTIVATDLLTGVVVGVLLSLVKLVVKFSRLRVRRVEDGAAGRTVLHLEGAATFLRLPKLAAALEAVPAATELHVRFEHLAYIDHACLDLLMRWGKQHEAAGGSLVLDWDSLTARFHSPSLRPRSAPAQPGAPGRPARREEARQVPA